MGTAVLVSRAVLAVVFAAAAFGKLVDPAGSRRAAEAFGLPRRLIGLVAVALPCTEILIVIALLVQPTSRAAALAAMLLLAVFVGAISRLIRRGIAADCHCFGQLHSSVAGWPTLLRNLGLGTLAAGIFVAGPGDSLGSLAGKDLALLVTSISAVMLAMVSVGFWRENRDLRAQKGTSERPARGLPRGTSLPDVELRGLDDSLATVGSALVLGRPAVLIQVGLQCAPCHDLLPELLRWRTVLASELTLIIVSSGPLEANRELAARFDAPGLLVSPDGEFGRTFELDITPSAVHIDEHGRVAALPAAGAGAIEALVRSARDDVESERSGAATAFAGARPAVVDNGQR